MEQDASMCRSLTMRSLREFLRDDRGATAIEYALIAAVMSLDTSLNGMYTTVSTSLN
jgi:Flp pilus assembly pilin Flp